MIVDLRSTIERCEMNCFECAEANDAVPAVGVCAHCGVGLRLDHLIDAHEFRVGGTHYACPHEAAARHPTTANVA
jgi:hypothetical protein